MGVITAEPPSMGIPTPGALSYVGHCPATGLYFEDNDLNFLFTFTSWNSTACCIRCYSLPVTSYGDFHQFSNEESVSSKAEHVIIHIIQTSSVSQAGQV